MTQEEQVKELISLTFNIPVSELPEDIRQEQVPGWDSVGHLNLMLAIEETFGVHVGIEQMAELISVSKIVSFLDVNTSEAG